MVKAPYGTTKYKRDMNVQYMIAQTRHKKRVAQLAASPRRDLSILNGCVQL